MVPLEDRLEWSFPGEKVQSESGGFAALFKLLLPRLSSLKRFDTCAERSTMFPILPYPASKVKLDIRTCSDLSELGHLRGALYNV